MEFSKPYGGDRVPEAGERSSPHDSVRFAHRVLIAVGIITAFVLTLLLLWYSITVLLMLFAGVLLAVFLQGLAAWLSRHTGLPELWSLVIVLLLLLGIIGVSLWFLTPRVADQLNQLSEQLPQSIRQLRQNIEGHPWGKWVIRKAPEPQEMVRSQGGVVSQITGFFSTTMGAFSGFVIILFFGLYLAFAPDLYTAGIIRLVPIHRRERAREILTTVNFTLRWWLIGRTMEMILVGVLTWLGLWMLGVSLALILGILAGLLNFIPYIGPLLGAVPAVLLALMDSPILALYVILLYVGVQSLESYLFTPVVHQYTVSMPPVLTLTAQILMGILLGFLGVLLATPLAAVLLVLVKMIYVEDLLGDQIEVAGEPGNDTH